MNSLSTHAHWHEALATVIECRYDFGAGRALAFGVPAGKHFRIAYNYFADGELHTGEFAAAKAMPQGTLFSIRYNPAAPHQNSHSESAGPGKRSSVILVGIVGSLVLSLVWFAVLRGCH